jgi:uncharacterized protein (DUF488 family)
MMTIYTVGHSTHPIEEFIAMLKAQEIETLVDVRTVPRSRYNPQFEQDALKKSLGEEGIGYKYMKGLGGLRHARKDSPNGGWRNSSFRGYADYMQTPEFAENLEELIALGEKERIAIMCAEAVPWRCHRSLVADALTARGIPVVNIMGVGKAAPHKMTKFAVVKEKGKTVLYPPETQELPGFETAKT